MASDWETLADLATRLPAEYQECRRARHPYEPLTVTERGRYVDVVERCPRCSTEIGYTLNRHTGEYVDPPRVTSRPSDYGIKGFGHHGTYVVRCALRRQRLNTLLQRKGHA